MQLPSDMKRHLILYLFLQVSIIISSIIREERSTSLELVDTPNVSGMHSLGNPHDVSVSDPNKEVSSSIKESELSPSEKDATLPPNKDLSSKNLQSVPSADKDSSVFRVGLIPKGKGDMIPHNEDLSVNDSEDAPLSKEGGLGTPVEQVEAEPTSLPREPPKVWDPEGLQMILQGSVYDIYLFLFLLQLTPRGS